MIKYLLKKKWFFYLISILIPFIAAYFCGEIYIRSFAQSGYRTPETMDNKHLQYMPALFAYHVFPQKELLVDGCLTVHKKGLNPQYRINKRGYRGKDFSVAKPKGAVRIIFYGGSTVFNIGSTLGRDWPHRVEEILKQSGFSSVEVINAGIPGHCSFDSFGKLFAEGHRFEPDYVVLYNTWNDTRYFDLEESLLRRLRPYSYVSPFFNYQNEADRLLCEYSQLYVRLREIYFHKKIENITKRKRQNGLDKKRFPTALGLKQFELNIEMFVDLARNIGAIPILMTQARARETKEYNLGNPIDKTENFSFEAVEKAEEIIRTIAKQKGVVLIDASKYLSGKKGLFIDSGHFSDKGAKQISEITARYMADLLK